MNFPTIFDWLERFEFLRGTPAAVGVLVTAVIIILAWEWRLALSALAAQYLLAGLLYVDVLDPRLAIVKVLTGLFVCLILTITAGQVNWGRLPPDVLPEEAAQIKTERRLQLGTLSVPASWLLRLTAVVTMFLVVLALVARSGGLLSVLPDGLTYYELAVMSLLAFGLLTLVLSPETLIAGLGVLMFFSGFELFYSVLDQSITMLAGLAAFNLLIAVVVALLVHRQYAIPVLLD